MQRTNAQYGFSLIEMIVAMTIVGILSASVMISVSDKSKRAVITQADQFRRDLSHVQMLALSWGVSLRLSVPAGGASYLVCLATSPTCAASSDAVIDPATGDRFRVVMSDGVVIQSSGGNAVDFDSLGRPQSGGSLIATNPARTYTLTGGATSTTVLLRPITGFAEAS